MLIEDIIGTSVGLGIREVQKIKTDCAQFLKESAGLPLLKALPVTYHNFHKVKVRQQKRKDDVSDAFNMAFGKQFSNIRQRAIFAYPNTPSLPQNTEPFYVFPIDGYQFMYSKEVHESNTAYQTALTALVEELDDKAEASSIIADVVRYTYVTHNLHEGISADAEVILYGIPYYYAVRASACDGYGKLLNTNHNK
jgi:hypothetical protein